MGKLSVTKLSATKLIVAKLSVGKLLIIVLSMQPLRQCYPQAVSWQFAKRWHVQKPTNAQIMSDVRFVLP